MGRYPITVYWVGLCPVEVRILLPPFQGVQEYFLCALLNVIL